MTPLKNLLKKYIVPLLIAGILLFLSLFFISSIMQEGISTGQLLFTLLAGTLCLVVGAITLSRPIAGLFAQPAGMLFNPADPSTKPLPGYSVAQAKQKKGLYVEAFKEYQKIAEQFPEEVKPYLAMIEIAQVNLRDAQRAEVVYRKALSMISNVPHRDLLRMTFKEGVS